MINLKLGKITNKENQIIIFKEDNELKSKQLKDFSNKYLNFKKGENIKIKLFTGEKNNYLLIKVKNIKNIEEAFESTIIPKIKDSLSENQGTWELNLDNNLLNEKQINLFTELLIHTSYSFDKYKSNKVSKTNLIIQSKFIDNKHFDALKDSIYFVRDLVNEPPAQINPETMEQIIKNKFKSKVKIEIIHGEELEKMGMNGIWYVGKGSNIPPRLIVLTYKPNKKDWYNIALIGKGVTFDSGGYNIKPTGYMEDMKSDMAGAATVLGILNYLIKTNSDKNIIVGVPLVENLVSGKSYKPGDIIKMYNGKTVEVGNTDAEGRLILADTLSYIEKKYNPEYIFDFATLTGAQIIALGNKIAAAIGRNDKLIGKIQKLSWEIKERIWQLPKFDPYFEGMKSPIADMNNVEGGRYGPGTITAGLFLSQFVKNKNWIHFDIAGPSGIFKGSDPLYGPGATGFGVRLGINIIKNLI